MFLLRLQQRRFDDAEALVPQMQAVLEREFPSNHPEVIDRTRDTARVAEGRGDYPRAESLLRESQARWERSLGPEHPYLHWGLEQLGRVLLRQGKVDEAVAHFRRALVIVQKSCEGAEENYPILAESLDFLGWGLLRQKNPSEAEPLLAKAVDLMRRHFGPSSRSLAFAVLHWAMAHAALGALPKAEELARESLSIMTDAWGADHPNTAVCMTELARILESQNRLTEAEPLFREELAMRRKL